MVIDRLAAATAEFSKQVQSKTVPTSAAANTASSTQAKQTAEDTTSFNSAANTVQGLAKAAVQVTPTRQAKVDALRDAVKSSQYQLDSAKIAQALADSV